MKFGIRGHDINTDSLEVLLQRCEELNIKSVQLVLKKSVKGFKEGMFSPSYAAEIGRQFKEKGIEISILGCYINPSNTNVEQLQKDMKFFVECLKYAKFMNAGMVALETGFVGDSCDPERNDTEQAYQYLFKNMKYLCDAAEKLGVMIGIEGVHVYVINSIKKMRRLVDDLNSPNVCVVFDPYNLINLKNYKNPRALIDEAFEVLGDEMAAIHLKDFVFENGDLRYTSPGTGDIDAKYIMTKANEFKPNLPIILENVKEGDFAMVAQNLEKIMQN